MSLVSGSPDWQDPRQPQGGADHLATFVVPAGSFFYNQALTETLGIYNRYLIRCIPPSTQQVSAQVTDSTTGIGGFYARYCAPGVYANFYLPASGILGQLNTVNLQFGSAIGTGGMTVQVYGMRYWPEGLRYDGLLPCQFSQAIQIPGSQFTGNLGFTPSPPYRFLVGAIVMPMLLTSGSNLQVLEGAVAGVSVGLGTCVTDSAGTRSESNANFGPGVLLDPGSGLFYNCPNPVSFGVPGAVLYDLVT